MIKYSNSKEELFEKCMYGKSNDRVCGKFGRSVKDEK